MSFFTFLRIKYNYFPKQQYETDSDNKVALFSVNFRIQLKSTTTSEKLTSFLCSQSERWTHPKDTPEFHRFYACGGTQQRVSWFLGRWPSKEYGSPTKWLQNPECWCLFLVRWCLHHIQWPVSQCCHPDIFHAKVWHTGAVDRSSQGQWLCCL
jgi:hypothetical protein